MSTATITLYYSVMVAVDNVIIIMSWDLLFLFIRQMLQIPAGYIAVHTCTLLFIVLNHNAHLQSVLLTAVSGTINIILKVIHTTHAR